MKFCETCGTLLIIKTSEDSRSLFCKKCNKGLPLTESITINFSFDKNTISNGVRIVDENEGQDLPTTTILCPECNEVKEAYWWMQQTRGADEPPTRFYECKKCKYRWREYS